MSLSEEVTLTLKCQCYAKVSEESRDGEKCGEQGNGMCVSREGGTWKLAHGRSWRKPV